MRIVGYIAVWLIALSGLAAAQSVGVTSAVNQSAVGLPPTAKPKAIYMGDEIIHNEKITTDSKGLLQILLADGTSFTVGPNSSMSINSFVYDPDAGSAKVVASLGKGVFRFIGGKSSKSPDGVTLNTPVGTVGVRGGISNLDFSGATAYHVDMIYGDGITLKNGTQVIGDIYHSGYSIVIGTDGKTSVVKTPPGWAAQFQTLMAGQGDGSSGSSKQVADNINKSDPGKTPGSTPGTPGDTTPPPTGPGTTDTTKVAATGPSTWNQIDNSTLKRVSATYNGTYSATLSYSVPGRHGFTSGTSSIDDADFALNYSFATRNGVATFDLPVNPVHGLTSVDIPVYADDHAGAGLASFSNKLITGIPHIATTSNTINGNFMNIDGEVAKGVVGTFDASSTVLNHQVYDLNGAFAGTR